MFSETPDIIPINSNTKHEVLSKSQIKELRNATLDLLNDVGVHFPSQTALKIFSDHGANVDWQNEIVRIPPDLVLKAMSTAPRSFVLGGREKRLDLTLDGSASYLATDGCGVNVIDLESREMRSSRKSDVAKMARVCDALPLVSFFWPLVSAQDYGPTAPLHECHAGLTNTLKHVRGGTTVPSNIARAMVELATVVAGSEEERRQRSPICANICTIAPLSHDHDGIETGLVFAEASIPTSYMAMPTMGSTAPASMMGALVMGDAEVISAMVLIQLAYPGAPVFHSNLLSLMDPRTGGYISDVSSAQVIIAVQMAHAWNVPSLGGGSLSSDAQDIGWQSGSAAGMGAMQVPLAGGEVCGYLGMLHGSMLLYPEQVILDHEICHEVLEVFSAYEFDESDLALDVISNVGPGSHFLRQKHTRQHIRDFRLSPILSTLDKSGAKVKPRAAAIEEFKRLDRSHQPEPLPEEKLRELDRIIAAADREAGLENS